MRDFLKATTISLVAALVINGCGGSGDDDSTTTSSDTTQTGYFVDSPVAGVDYQTSSGFSGTTDENGRFQFKEGDTVKFAIGKLELGETKPPADGLVTPEELANGDEELKVLLLRVLQALDSDDDPTNGITIPEDVKESLEELPSEVDIEQVASEEELMSLSTDLAEEIDEDYDGQIDVDPDTALAHYEKSIQMWHNGYRPDDTNHSNGNGQGNQNGHGNGNGQGNGQGNQNGHGNGNGQGNGGPTDDHGNGQQGGHTDDHGTFDINNYPVTENLTQELKDALAHMGNEERLAYDVYTNLYNYHVDNSGLKIMQLTNIAQRSEKTHVGIVQSVVRRYDLGVDDLSVVDPTITEEYNMSNQTEFDELPSGVYDIPAIQELYDQLYEKGIASQKDALEVGCMVEVTDVNDLDEYIQIAEESNATDIVEAFKALRSGSYNHYWAFDKGLKNLGVEEGCCSLGEDFCHPEYPTNSHSQN